MQVAFAGVTFTNCPTLIEVNGFPLLSVRGPETPGAPYRLSGFFADDTGEITLKIEDNVWSAGADNWDVECKGPLITIRNGPRLISLVLRQEPPIRLVVERINMTFEGIHLRGDDGVLEMSFDGKGWVTWKGCSVMDCRVGIAIGNR